MKDYRTLIKQLPSNTIVCALGEFNPPTVEHELLVKTVKQLSEQKRSDHVIFTTPSELIQEEKKENFLKIMFPKAKFKSLGESFFATAVKELNEKYKNVIIISGADQFDEFKKLKESTNVQIICIGDKDPDAASSDMKKIATKGLYEEFKKQLPSTIRDIDGKRLMNEMRTGMGLEPVKEQLVFVKDKLREKYFRGEIFNEGDIVESNGEKFEIVKRGSNHLLLKEESGKLVSKWIQDVKPTEEKSMKEAVIQPNGTDKIDANAPESDTGAKQDQVPKGKTKGFLTFYNYNVKENVNEAQSAQVKLQKAFEREQEKTKASNERAKLVMQQAKEKQAMAVQHTKEKESLQKESALNPNDPHTDYREKSKALHQLSLNKDVDQAHVTQRKLDLEKEYSKVKKEEVVNEEMSAYDKSEENKRSADSAKKQGDMFAHHLHMADHHDNLAQWHASKGRHGEADRHADKSEQHHEKAMGFKEEVELDEAKKKKVVSGSDVPAQLPAQGNTFDPFFKEDVTDEEVIDSVTDEDVMDLYEEDEIVLEYEDDGEEVPALQEEQQYDLMEVLSRAERLKGKIRLRKTSAKRERSTKIAIKRFSNPATINKRARRLAIKLMKKRMLRGRDYSKISVGEKERMEKTLSKRKDQINRVAAKLVTRIRRVEKSRMSKGKVSKGTMPAVF